ncbi:hypothetical protein [Rubinisphaera margarita]|uniref:hypothetical protein n=1 Tax=Rubinisphaera margarita TaxID=2909586 RepID=UPI001EE7BF1F|nr:hypothetical protein [Rubinisphaera margarita]MCG6155793.1 hypothetical protein [Rubinisphaera margarita]
MKSSWLALLLFLVTFGLGCAGGDSAAPPETQGESTEITDPEELEMEEGLSN